MEGGNGRPDSNRRSPVGSIPQWIQMLLLHYHDGV